MDCRLTHHPLGFWTLKNPPSPQQLTTHYRDRYFQEEHGNYRREYSAAERQWFAIPNDRGGRSSLRRIAECAGSTCRRLLAECPIDWFLASPTANYVIDKTLGAGAHAARLAVAAVLSRRPMNDVLRYLEAMAAVGMGRQISAVLVPPC